MNGAAAVGSDRVKGNGQQRMIVKEAIAGTYHGLTVAARIPSEADTRSDILVIAGNAFCDAKRLFRSRVHGRGRSNSGVISTS